MKKLLKENKFYIIYFIAVSLLAFVFPLSGDDLTWVTSDGVNLLKNGFADYNGRYLGNISAIVLTRLDFVRPFVKGFTLTTILYLIEKFSGNNSKDYISLSGMLLLFPSMMLIQGVVWTAGFANYCLSAMLIMVCLYIIFYKEKKNFLHIILLVVLGVAGQLFMETYTLFTLIMSAFAIFYFAVKNKKADFASIIYFISCIAGAVIMFTNSVYGSIVSGKHNYQSFSVKDESLFGSLLRPIENLFSKVFSNVLIGCFPVMIVLFIICIAKMKKSNSKNKKIVTAVNIISLLTAVAFGVVTALEFPKYQLIEEVKIYLGFACFFIFLPIALMIFLYFDKKTKLQVGKYLVMIAITSLPFCIIGPVGSRCFLPANLFMIMIAGTLHDFNDGKKVSKAIKTAGVAVFILDLVCYSIISFSCWKKVETARAQVEEGKKVVQLEKTTLGFMLHAPDEEWHHLVARRFCEHNNLPEDTKFEF
ncbi:MAG: hypothetical protein E7536_01180 [Ruminococcaceae bacterium]|nr:hypothetical protein [Oscillospiraceae bacterium]